MYVEEKTGSDHGFNGKKNTNCTDSTNILGGTKIYMNLAQMWMGVRMLFTT